MGDEQWQLKHEQVMKDFLQYLNSKTDHYILKGGSSLRQCYGMNRFSEDLDFDSKDRARIKEIVNGFCKERGYNVRVAKNTPSVQRYMINYGDDGHPLKVETSFRRTMIPQQSIEKRNGIVVYEINEILAQKAAAYSTRDKVRDMYDISFIVNKYENDLHIHSISFAANIVSYKGLEQYDYLINTEQEFGDIDQDELLDSFMMACEKMGVFSEREIDIDRVDVIELDVDGRNGPCGYDDIDREP